MRVSALAFSLIETLFAAMILCVVFFLVIGLYPTSMLGMMKGREEIAATNLAQRVLEERRATAFDSLAEENREEIEDGIKFRYQVSVTEGIRDVKNVKVAVQWDSSTKKARQVTLETRFFRFRNP